ncbi:MAG: hypothetical protein ACP5OA_00595 [Candidatus Woesearchaeota archaeon]
MLFLYPHIEEVLSNHKYVFLDDGSHNVVSVQIRDQDLVYKSLISEDNQRIRTRIGKILRTIDAPLKQRYMKEFPFLNYRETSTGKEQFDIESKTLDEWNKRGIPCMQILERQERSLVYQKYVAINHSKILKSHSFPNFPYTQMLDIIYSIRSNAKSENNPSILHPDMLSKNFLYLLDDNKTIVIDPGVKLKNLPFEELDSKINLVFMYDLNTYPDGKKYIEAFLDTLNKDEKKHIKEINTSPSKEAMLYFETKKLILNTLRGKASKNFIDVYSRGNILKINRMLDRHIK